MNETMKIRISRGVGSSPKWWGTRDGDRMAMVLEADMEPLTAILMVPAESAPNGVPSPVGPLRWVARLPFASLDDAIALLVACYADAGVTVEISDERDSAL